MRRSSVVQLTLLPVLATAAVASGDPPPTAEPSNPPTAEPSDPPTAAPSEPPTAGGYSESSYDSVWYGAQGPIEAPISPPGMTPTIIELTCDEDPNWRLRADCDWDEGYYYDGGVIRGGFGQYFYGGYGG